MRIEELWTELEASPEAGASHSAGWVLRLARADPACALHIGVELATGRRGLLLQTTHRLVPGKRLWPVCRGLEMLAVTVAGGNTLFGVALKEARHSDVFTVLAEDLARRVTEAPVPAERVSALLSGLTRWKKFLASAHDGLTDEAQRGLWGELYFLREHLLPLLGPSAITGWKGPERSHQDFQFRGGAVEVKTTLAKQPQVVRITSERQLDDSGWPALFLSVIAVDTRESGGETLPEMVATLRAKLALGAGSLEQFEDAIVAVGYLEAHVSRYGGRGYLVRSQKLFRVRNGFPRLIEEDLHSGVGDANYGLAVAACAGFTAPLSELQGVLGANVPKASKRKARG